MKLDKLFELIDKIEPEAIRNTAKYLDLNELRPYLDGVLDGLAFASDNDGPAIRAALAEIERMEKES